MTEQQEYWPPDQPLNEWSDKRIAAAEKELADEKQSRAVAKKGFGEMTDSELRAHNEALFKQAPDPKAARLLRATDE